MTKRQTRAFRILWGHRFPNGRSVPRSDYYPTDNGVLIELLIRSKGALEIPMRDSAPIPDAPLDTQPTPSRDAEVDADVLGEAQPDWDYRTITDMRIWLDQSGAPLPSSSTRKQGHVEACKAAWANGLRPRPLWGLPGGPACGAGLPGPNANDLEIVKDAIATAEAAGVEIPDELFAHRELLLNPEDPDETQDEHQADEDAADAELADAGALFDKE